MLIWYKTAIMCPEFHFRFLRILNCNGKRKVVILTKMVNLATILQFQLVSYGLRKKLPLN